jgi:hypothetical protein
MCIKIKNLYIKLVKKILLLYCYTFAIADAGNKHNCDYHMILCAVNISAFNTTCLAANTQVNTNKAGNTHARLRCLRLGA